MTFGMDIEAHRKRLYSYALRLCRNRDDAEDLVQETMFLALRAEHQFKPGTNLAAWLTTIMLNKRIAQARRWNLVGDDADGHHTASMPGNEDQGAACEARDALAHLADIPPKFRRVLVMTGDGMQINEIAALEGVPDGTVKSRIHRARVAFADLIGGTP